MKRAVCNKKRYCDWLEVLLATKPPLFFQLAGSSDWLVQKVQFHHTKKSVRNSEESSPVYYNLCFIFSPTSILALLLEMDGLSVCHHFESKRKYLKHFWMDCHGEKKTWALW